ncbi:shikimate dehydrogenase family protein [Bradyrhizobium japonicum]|uniref:shikimate dehydrogenase family protein n=1 Tax=Bradyrhizobium japonicum TaxID=375 RepID=UPI001BAC374C|nr:shikimate dehydrogenase [Bradyrhizobium japonicum]MBR0911523.1 shikimate dehydrogenase [Bradyrhizobium japonicum]
MQSFVDGNTRIFAILGDPIGQVKSPAQVTASLRARSHNAILIPLHVTSNDFDDVVRTLKAIRNLDGLVITVPHKFAAFQHCKQATERASFLQAVNVMRRSRSGAWEGDMCDGQGFVDAILQKGGVIAGKRAFLIGAGGAGTAIGYALLEAGVEALSIHDIDQTRQRELVHKLQQRFGDRAAEVESNPREFDIVANATPAGMENLENSPVNLDQLRPTIIVGDVVTAVGETALIRSAQSIGCICSTGHDMYRALQETMVDFLLSSD